jgi:hypothetical protein
MQFKMKCGIILGYYTGTKWNSVGSIKVDLEELVDKGDVIKTLTLEDVLHPVTKAIVKCTFRIEHGKLGSVFHSARVSRLVSAGEFNQLSKNSCHSEQKTEMDL